MNGIGSKVHTTDHHHHTKDIYQQERILLTKGKQHLINAEPEADNNRPTVANDQISISKEAKGLQEEAPATMGLSHHKGVECCRMTLLRNVFERFIGRSMPIIPSSDVVAANETDTTATETSAENAETPTISKSLALSLQYSRTETVSFATTGSFQTKDGQEVNFSLELNFTRQVLAEQTLSANFAEAIKDPFKVEYNGFAAQITQTSFSFTIDCCKPGEEIVLDNAPVDEPGDVIAEEGTTAAVAEGTETAKQEEGTEIAAVEDGETAPVEEGEEKISTPFSDFFDRLRVWSKDKHGFHRPVMFGVKGVGVMFHENQGLEFTLKKLGHFLNKMAKIADRFNQVQQTQPVENGETEETQAVSSQA